MKQTLLMGVLWIAGSDNVLRRLDKKLHFLSSLSVLSYLLGCSLGSTQPGLTLPWKLLSPLQVFFMKKPGFGVK